MPELLFILVLALLVFGPKRLPQVGRTLGKGLREFKRATTDLKRTVETEISSLDIEDARPTPTSASTPATTPSSAAAAPITPDNEAVETGTDAAEAAPEPAAEKADSAPGE